MQHVLQRRSKWCDAARASSAVRTALREVIRLVYRALRWGQSTYQCVIKLWLTCLLYLTFHSNMREGDGEDESVPPPPPAYLLLFRLNAGGEEVKDDSTAPGAAFEGVS